MKSKTPISILLMCTLAVLPGLAQAIETSPAAQAVELKQLKIHYAILQAEKKQLISERQELEEKLAALQSKLGNENKALKHQLKLQSSEKVDLMLRLDKLDKELRQAQKEKEVITAELLSERSANKNSREKQEQWKSDQQALEEKFTSIQKKLTEQQNLAQGAEIKRQQLQADLAAAVEQARNNEQLLHKPAAEKTALTRKMAILTAEKKPPARTTVLQPLPGQKKSSQTSRKTGLKKPTVPDSTQVVSGIERAVNGWSKAWSEQNVEKYLSFYSPALQLPASISRTKWEKQRRTRLKRPKFINVSLEDIKIDVVDPTYSRVVFIQSFKSNTYADTVTKQLVMKKENASWKILSENEVK